MERSGLQWPYMQSYSIVYIILRNAIRRRLNCGIIFYKAHCNHISQVSPPAMVIAAVPKYWQLRTRTFWRCYCVGFALFCCLNAWLNVRILNGLLKVVTPCSRFYLYSTMVKILIGLSTIMCAHYTVGIIGLIEG